MSIEHLQKSSLAYPALTRQARQAPYKSTSVRSTLLAFADSSSEKHYAAAVMTACMGVNQFPGRIIELRRTFYSDFKNADI